MAPEGGIHRYVPAVVVWAGRNVRGRAGLLFLSVSTSHCHSHSFKCLSCRNAHRLLAPSCSPRVPVSSFLTALSFWDQSLLYPVYPKMLSSGNKLEMTSKSEATWMYLHLNCTKLSRRGDLNEILFLIWRGNNSHFVYIRVWMKSSALVLLHVLSHLPHSHWMFFFLMLCSLIFGILLSWYPLSPRFHHSLSGPWCHLSACQSTLIISRDPTFTVITP